MIENDSKRYVLIKRKLLLFHSNGYKTPAKDFKPLIIVIKNVTFLTSWIHWTLIFQKLIK